MSVTGATRATVAQPPGARSLTCASVPQCTLTGSGFGRGAVVRRRACCCLRTTVELLSGVRVSPIAVEHFRDPRANIAEWEHISELERRAGDDSSRRMRIRASIDMRQPDRVAHLAIMDDEDGTRLRECSGMTPERSRANGGEMPALPAARLVGPEDRPAVRAEPATVTHVRLGTVAEIAGEPASRR